MSLISQIETDVTSAMKARDQLRLDTLRMLRAAFKNEQIALGHELADDEALKVISRQIKQRKDAQEQYQAAGRTEAATKEAAEAGMLEAYLPAQLDDAALATIVAEVIAATSATGTSDFGKVMGQVMQRTKGQADGNRVSALVKAKLA